MSVFTNGFLHASGSGATAAAAAANVALWFCDEPDFRQTQRDREPERCIKWNYQQSVVNASKYTHINCVHTCTDTHTWQIFTCRMFWWQERWGIQRERISTTNKKICLRRVTNRSTHCCCINGCYYCCCSFFFLHIVSAFPHSYAAAAAAAAARIQNATVFTCNTLESTRAATGNILSLYIFICCWINLPG